MKNKVLVVGDIHGRKFWEKPCQEWQGPIIFLGDYHDPYPQEISKEKSLENLENLVSYVNKNKHRCTCLLGNHDGNYLINARLANRIDYDNYEKVKALLKELNLKISYQLKDVVFSHSGILPKWLKNNSISLEDVPNLKFDDKALTDISPWRGGDSEVGGVLFGDIREYYMEKHIPNIFQIFGHTQVIKGIIEPDFACIDCRKCFILDLDSKELKEYC